MITEAETENSVKPPAPEQAVQANPESGMAKDSLIAPELVEIVDTRLAILMKLESLGKERETLLGDLALPGDARSELNRQVREFKRFPTSETIAECQQSLETRLNAMEQGIQSGQTPPMNEFFKKAVELARRQWKLLLLWHEMVPSLLDVGSKLAEPEPLYQILVKTNCSPRAMFGWAVYAAAVEAMKKMILPQRKLLQDRIDQAKGSECEMMKASLGNVDVLLSAIMRELTAIEPIMMNAFWMAYEEAAVFLVSGKVLPQEQANLRAFLRYGYISSAPWFLDSKISETILDDSAQYIEKLDDSPKAIHILHADEYIDLVAKGMITPSIDEDLELNQRGTNPWIRDKSLRRVIAAKKHTAAYNRLIEQLEQRIKVLQDNNGSLEKQLAGARDNKIRIPLREKIQNCRVEIARRTLAIKQLKETFLPEEELRCRGGEAKLTETGGPYSPEELARNEASRIHRICRLCAKLKDPFPPFSLRDSFKPDNWSSRTLMAKEIEEIEKCDPLIFRELVIPAKQAEQRVYIRYSPIHLLVPCCGIMSFSWNPRSVTEEGRLVIPLYTQRAGILKALLYTVFADFRWDTSKESAGMDVLTSDTLVAAYCNVRWDYRRRSKEVRQKAGIYSHESDRKNWRHHYFLYITSAKEGGKKLFFKCQEIYDAVVKYMGLPDGVKKLKK